jgi:hypothetical protein
MVAAAFGLGLGLGATASADVITQDIEFTWSDSMPDPSFTFAPFDDQDGTRILEGISLRFLGQSSTQAEFGNNGSTFLAAGTWEGEATFTTVLNFSGAGPLVGLGGVGASGITGDLGAGTGSPFDPPGDPTVITTLAGEIDFTRALGESTFAYFSADVAELTATLGRFTDTFVIAPPEGIVSAVYSDQSQSGTFTLTYDFTVVPAPGAFAVLGALGLAGSRRRRG